MVTVTDDGPVLRATVLLDGCSPDRALAAFTDPAVLARWWGGELTAELSPGGIYSVWFAKLEARMTGEVLSYAPGSRLDFRWGWEHEPGPQVRTVTVRAEPAGSGRSGPTGAVLTVEHGPYGVGEGEAAARAEHREGWEFFLPRLAGVLAA
jgi:uncharacterized protein YndB with AHSA1/START domain